MPHVTTWVKDPTEIVFIDPQAPDCQMLAAGVKPGVEVVVLDPNSDGVQQIANFLPRHPDPNLTTIDIVAHGEGGMLLLGNTLLASSTLDYHRNELAAIGSARVWSALGLDLDPVRRSKHRLAPSSSATGTRSAVRSAGALAGKRALPLGCLSGLLSDGEDCLTNQPARRRQTKCTPPRSVPH